MPVPSKGRKGSRRSARRSSNSNRNFWGAAPTRSVCSLCDMLVVRLKVLTPAERQLAKTAEGVDMVKRLRQNLIAQGRERLCEQVAGSHRCQNHGVVHRHRYGWSVSASFVFTWIDLEANFR